MPLRRLSIFQLVDIAMFTQRKGFPAACRFRSASRVTGNHARNKHVIHRTRHSTRRINRRHFGSAPNQNCLFRIFAFRRKSQPRKSQATLSFPAPSQWEAQAALFRIRQHQFSVVPGSRGLPHHERPSENVAEWKVAVCSTVIKSGSRRSSIGRRNAKMGWIRLLQSAKNPVVAPKAMLTNCGSSSAELCSITDSPAIKHVHLLGIGIEYCHLCPLPPNTKSQRPAYDTHR